MVGATFMPDDDSSEFAVNVRTPPGYSLAHIDQIVAQIEERLRTIPEIRDLFNPVAVAGLTIPSSRVGQVRLDNVATLTHGTGLVQIDRQERMRNIAIVFNLAPGVAMNKVMDAVTREVDQIQSWSSRCTTTNSNAKQSTSHARSMLSAP